MKRVRTAELLAGAIISLKEAYADLERAQRGVARAQQLVDVAMGDLDGNPTPGAASVIIFPRREAA